MKCPNCGAETPDSSKFCIECGTRLQGETPASDIDKAHTEADTDSTLDGETADEERSEPKPPALRRRQRRRLIAAEPDLSESSSGEAQSVNAPASGASIGDTMRYDSAALKKRSEQAAAAKETADKSRSPQEETPHEETEQGAAHYKDATQAASPAPDEVSGESPDTSAAEEHQETAKTADEAETETVSAGEAPTRSERQRSRRFPKKILWLVIACAAVAAVLGIWQWSVNTPRARMTQALRNGDIMAACQIYDEELREEGLTANEVYYLCAAAEQVADDFEQDPAGESYDGRVLLLDRLGALPYRDVQDAVAAARKRLELRHTVVGHINASAEAERRGDYITAIEELEAALADSPDDDTLKSEIARLEDAYRQHALDAAAEYVAAGNVAQARLVLLGAMLENRFSKDSALRAMLDEITNEQIQQEGMSGAARNSLDMSRLGQAAFLMENVKEIPSATSHLTAEDLMGVLTGLYQWRDYNSSPIAGTDPVLAVIRDALPERTGTQQWPLRSAARPVQMLCDALFGQRAENVNLAEVLGPQLFGSYKYENGWYYFASMTIPTASVSYADPSPLPHLQDNTYRFFSSSTDRSDDRLYEMEIRPTMTSPFGFTVSSVVTVAEGREALAEAQGSIQPPAASPTPSPQATPTAEEEPDEQQTEQAPPEFDYAPSGSLTGGMVFPDSDMRYLTDSDLEAVANTYSDVPAALELARNEIYARRGHIFSDPAYQNYFAQFAWYSPSHSVSDGELNEFELANLRQIATWGTTS